jgi:predicted small secreted protein
MRKILLIIVVLLLATPLVGCGATQKAGEKNQEAETKTEATVGQPVKAGDVTLTVMNWSASAGDDFSTPEPGNHFIVVDLEVVNNSMEPYPFSTMMELGISTPEGRKYDQAAYFPEPKYPDGEIAAGERARGNVAFEVPTSTGTMYLAFTPIMGESAKIKLQ